VEADAVIDRRLLDAAESPLHRLGFWLDERRISDTGRIAVCTYERRDRAHVIGRRELVPVVTHPGKVAIAGRAMPGISRRHSSQVP
jgi:hypothetical protein